MYLFGVPVRPRPLHCWSTAVPPAPLVSFSLSLFLKYKLFRVALSLGFPLSSFFNICLYFYSFRPRSFPFALQMASDDETCSSVSTSSSPATSSNASYSDHMSECSMSLSSTKNQESIHFNAPSMSVAVSCKPVVALCNPSQSKLETLPVEIINNILSYLVHPRSRLPGLTETQSAHDFPHAQRRSIMEAEDLTTPPDTDRWATNLFAWTSLRHPFNALALTSKRCHELVEGYSAHLVKRCNMFNLPFEHLDKYGAACVYPDLSGIVYRRLWLQHAPRRCIYCYAVLDCYPYRTVKRLIAACGDCFYRQALTLDEIERQYHISSGTILASSCNRGESDSVWILRIDVEALALQLYGTRAFHYAHKEQFDKPCSLCAVTRFNSIIRAPIAKLEPQSSPGVIRRTRSRRRQLLPQHRRRWS